MVTALLYFTLFCLLLVIHIYICCSLKALFKVKVGKHAIDGADLNSTYHINCFYMLYSI